jgi:hypothetical protein
MAFAQFTNRISFWMATGSADARHRQADRPADPDAAQRVPDVLVAHRDDLLAQLRRG